MSTAAFVGAKNTVIVQLEFGPMPVPQVFVWVKLPLVAMFAMDRLFFASTLARVTVFAALVVPVTWAENTKVFGERPTVWANAGKPDAKKADRTSKHWRGWVAKHFLLVGGESQLSPSFTHTHQICERQSCERLAR